jgi:hypothetical protein
MHPSSLVVSAEGESREGHGAGTEPGSLLKIEKGMVKAVTPRDRRLPANTLVLGVTADGVSRAYVLQVLQRDGGVANDEVGGEPVVLLTRPGSVLGLAYSRLVEGRLLSFTAADGGARDVETGSTWDYEGRAVNGPLKGTRLAFVRSLVGEWYEFAASHPGVELYGVEGTEDGAASAAP